MNSQALPLDSTWNEGAHTSGGAGCCANDGMLSYIENINFELCASACADDNNCRFFSHGWNNLCVKYDMCDMHDLKPCGRLLRSLEPALANTNDKLGASVMTYARSNRNDFLSPQRLLQPDVPAPVYATSASGWISTACRFRSLSD